jgi:stage II sporulation protein E
MYKLVFYLFYGVLAGVSAYCISAAAGSFRCRRAIDFTSPVSCAFAIVYILLSSALCSVKIPYINFGIIFGIAVTLTAAYHYRYTGGVLCGSLTVCGAFLASQEYGMSVVMLPATGLLTGYLHKKKPGTAAGFFTGISFVFVVFSGISEDILFQMLNIIAGTSLFLVVSPKFSDKWIITGHGSDMLTETAGIRMGFLADSIETVRRESGKISEILSRNTEPQRRYTVIGAEVCISCRKRIEGKCGNNESVIRGFRKLSEMYEVSADNFPQELAGCVRKDELAEAFERYAQEKMTAKLIELRFSESRRIMSEQIKITEEIIESAWERVDVHQSEPVSRAIRIKLSKYGFNAKNVIAYYNFRGRLIAEIYFEMNDAPESYIRICDLIADELRIKLNCAEPVCSGRDVRIRVFEGTDYIPEVYAASVCADNSEETGDTSSVFGDGTGVSYVMLSDGMGSGRGAAVESRMVVSMFRKLITSGVNYSSAIKLINSIMLTKSREESFATLDAVRIDPDSGTLTVIKSGAAATLIRHGDKVMKISSPTFPIGIVEEAESFSETYDFDENDIIIMFSDGINENEYRFIKELLMCSSDIKSIVDEICAKAELFNSNIRQDDVTVIGVKINKSDNT